MEPSFEVLALSGGAKDEETRTALSGSCPVIKILHFNVNRLLTSLIPTSRISLPSISEFLLSK
jgi:hypothetical protein